MRRRHLSPESAPESALARLLEVESRLEAMLEQARLDADAAEGNARALAETREMSRAAELAAEEADLSASLAAEAEAQIAEERDRLAAVRARYQSLDDGQVDSLAAWVVEEVLRAAGEGAT